MPSSLHHGKFWLLLLANILFCRTAFPQQDAPPVPPTKPAPGAHWSIAYERKGADPLPDESPSDKPSKTHRKRKDAPAEQKPAKGDKAIQSEEYRVTNTAACVTKKYSDGSERTIYVIDGVAYRKSDDGKKIMALSLGGTNDSEIIFTEHYPGCDWLQAHYYVGTEPRGERRCLHFFKPAASKSQAGAVPQDYDAFATYFDREAWVDAETGLPDSFRQGSLRGTYHHESVSDDPIEVPEEITQAVKRYNGEN